MSKFPLSSLDCLPAFHACTGLMWQQLWRKTATDSLELYEVIAEKHSKCDKKDSFAALSLVYQINTTSG